MTDLGTLGGDFSSASAINNVGQVVGAATTSTGDQHAFLFQGTTMSDLGTLGGSTSKANAINNYAQIVGSSTLANGQTRAFVYYNGAMTDLGAVGLGAQSSTANGINDQGEIVGTSDRGQAYPNTSAAFLFFNGQMSIASARLSEQYRRLFAEPSALNSFRPNRRRSGRFNPSLEIGGSAFIVAAGNATFFSLPQESYSGFPDALLPRLRNQRRWGGRRRHSTANTLTPSPPLTRAMIYYQGLTVDLNILVNLTWAQILSNLDHADGINNAGQIVGSGTTKDGSSHAYLLTPIPTPSP